MYFDYNGFKYPIEIVRKNNKNTYIKYKNKSIVVSTNWLLSDKKIMSLVEKNSQLIISWIDKDVSDDSFYLWGEKCDIIYDSKYRCVLIEGNNIYARDERMLEQYLIDECKIKFNEHLFKNIDIFEEKLPEFYLKIRKMKTRWGVCNKNSMSITLNFNLVKYDPICLDYVIIHELSHFIYFNHSKEFWDLVSKYCPNYKSIKKMLMERK